ncbi:MAG TPA: hypothetical protein VLL08_09540 [Kineosporiaceae bacterium]|nr:hypothetical protein [Kineosporiaceae bacterium]
MSSKAVFSTAVAAILGATMLITGPSFAASTPAPAPATTKPAAADRPVAKAPAETRAPRAVPIRTKPRFTG